MVYKGILIVWYKGSHMHQNVPEQDQNMTDAGSSHFPYKRHRHHWLGLIFFQLRLYMCFKSAWQNKSINENKCNNLHAPTPCITPVLLKEMGATEILFINSYVL